MTKRKLIIELSDDELDTVLDVNPSNYVYHSDSYFGPIPTSEIPDYIDTLLEEVYQLSASDAELRKQLSSKLNSIKARLDLAKELADE